MFWGKSRKSLDPETLERITEVFTSLLEHLHQFGDCSPINPMQADTKTARLIFHKWRGEILHEKNYLGELKEIWPDGTRFFREMENILQSQSEWVDLCEYWHSLIHAEHLDLKKIRECVLKNRKWGVDQTQKMTKSINILFEMTGLNDENFKMDWD
jgi:hypothetical protein